MKKSTNPDVIPMKPKDLEDRDLSLEVYREYDFGGRVYKIQYPVRLLYRKGGTTHRVVDDKGVVHCVPAPGHNGCVLRWKTLEGSQPCQF